MIGFWATGYTSPGPSRYDSVTLAWWTPAEEARPMDAPMQTIPVPPRPTRRRRRSRSYSVTAVAGLSMLVTQCAPQQCAPAPVPAPSALGWLQQVIDLTNAAAGQGRRSAPLTSTRA